MRNPDLYNRRSRLGDIKRWQSMNFVVGYRINTSKGRINPCDQCAKLLGEYPKSFIWSGWHDECHCFITPILMGEAEYNEDELCELRAALSGVDYTPKESVSTIKYLPINFLLWYQNNASEILKGDVLPDFITNNINLITSSYEFYKSNGK